jgi:prepilin-type N-terminal cleavage/methylation domain-containing protein
MSKNKKAFTLIELMVVIAIIAVLTTLIIGAVTAARHATTESANRSNADTLRTSLEAYYSRYRVYCGATGAGNPCTVGTCESVRAALSATPPNIPTSFSGSASAGGGCDVTTFSAQSAVITLDDWNGTATTDTRSIP